MRLKNNLIFMVLALVTVVAFFFLRFYHIQNRVIFDFDQEEFSNQVYRIVHDGRLTLLGPHILSDRGFFLGPYFIYALVPFYLLSGLHPFGLVYFLIFYNLAFFIAASRIVSKIWSRMHAIFFLLAWATNALIVRYDTTPWNPISIPLGVLAVWYFLHKIFTTNKLIHWALLGLTFGLFLNQHFQFVFLMLFAGVFLILVQKRQRIISLKGVLAALAAFVATYIPLLLFDVRHQFLNAQLFIQFFTDDIGGNIERGRFIWIEIYEQIFQPVIGYRDPILAISFIVLNALTMLYMTRQTTGFKNYFYKASFVMWVMTPFLFMLYNKRITDYYLISLYPFIYITLIDALITGKRYILLTIAAALVLYINYSLLLMEVRPLSLGLNEKDKAIRIMLANTKPNAPINVSFSMPPGIATGYTYLLNWYKVEKIDKPAIPLIEINNPKKDGDVTVNEEIGIKIPQEVRK